MTDSQKLDLLIDKVSSLDDKVSSLDNRVSSLDDKVSSLDKRVSSIEKDVKDTKLTLENVTNKNISIIAEGHLDLGRKLDKALMVENEKELLLIRVNILEDEVRKLKEQQLS